MVDERLPWTPVALGTDVPSGVTRAVILAGKELVAWRSESGTVQVWEDRCPHRGMRLSYGFVRGERLACLYHGWEYGTGASCQRIPAHPDLTVPASIKANAWTVAEAGGLIWVSDDAAVPAPEVPAWVPLASLAVAASTARLTERFGELRPLARTQAFGTTLYLGWHATTADRTMLHAVIEPQADKVAALAALRLLRHDLEAEMAA